MLLGHGHRLLPTGLSKIISNPPSKSSTRVSAHRRALRILTRPNAKPRAFQQPTSWTQVTQIRGAKRRSVVPIAELPQGAIGGLPLSHQDDGELDYPITLQEVQNNMLRFSHCIVLTRVGGFYELYFEHADEYAPLLLLKRTTKKVAKRSTRPPVSMAGFPAYQLDRYLKILVQDMKKSVAICEEFPNDEITRAKGGPMFTRRVARVITPGTLIDEHFMDPWDCNYLLSVHIDPKDSSSPIALREQFDEHTDPSNIPSGQNQVGLAWIDLASGDFLTQTTDLVALPTVVARIKPREIVLDDTFRRSDYSEITKILEDDDRTITYQSTLNEGSAKQICHALLEDIAGNLSKSELSPEELIAAGYLLQYVNTQLVDLHVCLRAPVKYRANEHLSIDRHSLKALELRATLRDGIFEGSLLHSLKRTVTKSGTRLLAQRLISPSMSIPIINERLDFVQELIQYPQLREKLVVYLKKSFDSSRLVTKFAYGRGDADDLVELAKTIDIATAISDLIKTHCASRDGKSNNSFPEPLSFERIGLEVLQQRMEMKQCIDIARRIYAAIDEQQLSEYHRVEDEEANQYAALAQDVVGREADENDRKALPKSIQHKRNSIVGSFKSATDGREDIHILQRTASSTLLRLHKRLDAIMGSKHELESELREDLGAESLTLRWTPNLAHIGHVKGKDVNRTTERYPRSLSSSKSTRTFHIPEWTQLGARMNETRFNIRQEERQILTNLRKLVVKNLVKLRRNAAVLDEIDVACAFATLAVEKHLVRPTLTTSASHHIVGGRHPIVESSLLEQGRSFVPNDCLLGDAERMWLITGPNMAGKSTYLRQNVIISILAQTGSFVPAEYAKIGLVDKVFSRVGSADNLYQGQSTFFVEMLETAQILKEATSRSFVIMDEVGRGTTPEDGVAVSYAALHHLHYINRCRTLFATHFHALADMTKDFEKLGYYCNDVREQSDGGFSYMHRLRKGINRESHALKVAQIAGLPQSAIAVAANVLQTIKPSISS